MELKINTLDDVKKINKQDFVDNKIDAITIMGVDMTKYGYVGKRMLSQKIENNAIRDFANNRNLLEAAYWTYGFEYASIQGAFIDNKFRASLSDNDKVILMSTYKLSNIAEKLEAKIKGKI